MQQDKVNNLRNRPKAIDYAEEQVKRGGGQMTSYYDYLKNDPASYFYQQLKDSPFLKGQYWTEAANKGELDHLVYLLQSTKSDTFDSTAFNKLKGYENFMDYDTYMLALELPHLDNNVENREPKIFGGHNFGNFTDREWAEKIFDEAIGRWNAEILRDGLNTKHWTVRTAKNYFVGGGAKVIKFFSGGVKMIDNIANTGIGAYEVILEGTRRGINSLEPIQRPKDLIFSNAFLKPFEEDPSKLRAFATWLDAVSFELQRNYTTINIDQVKAYDQGWRPDQDSSFFDRVKEGDSAAIGAGYTTWGRIGNGVFETLGSIGTALLLGQAVGAIGSAGTTVSTAGGALGGIYAGVAATAPLFSTTSTIFYAGQFGGQVQDRVSTLNRNGISYKDMNAGEVISNALTKTALYILFDMAAGKLIGYTNIDKFLKIGQGSGKTGTALGKQLAKGVSTSTGKAAAMVGMNYAIDAAKQGLKTTSRQLISFTVDQFYDKFITDPDQKYNNKVTFKSLGQVFINGFLTSLVMSMFADAKANMREEDRAVGFGDDGPFRLGYFQSINYKNSLRIIGEKINRLNELEKLDKLTEAQRQEYYDTIVMMQALTSTLGDVYKYLDSDEIHTIMKFDEAFMTSIVAKAGNIDLYELQKENSRGIIGPQSKMFEHALYSQFKTMDRLEANYAKHYANYLYATLLDIQGINVESYQGARPKEAEFTESTSNAKDTTIAKYIDVKNAIKEAESKLQDAQVTKIKSVINSSTKPGSPEVKDLPPAQLTEWQKNLASLGVDTLVGIDGNTVIKSGNVIFAPNDLIINRDLPNVVTGVAYDVAIDTVLASLNKRQLNLIKDSYKEVVGRDDGIEKAVIAFMRDKNFYTYILLKSRERGYGDKAFDTLTIIDQLIKDHANPRVKNGSLSDKAYKTLMKEVQNTMRTGLVTLATNYNKLDLNKISDEILSPELKKQIAEHHNVKFTEFIDEGLSSIALSEKLSADLIKKRAEDYNRQIDLYRDILRPEEIQILKDKVASNVRNEVRDAYMFLIILANSVKNVTNQKAVYLPAFSSSPTGDIAIYQAMIDLENTLGIRVPSFLSGHFTEDKLTVSVRDLAKTSGLDLNHRQDRLTLARELIYYKSHRTLTLSSEGAPIKIISTQELFNSELLGKDGITKLYELARKNDNKIKVKDISKVKPARVIAETDIIFSSDIPEGFAGGLKSSAIYINTNSMNDALETIAHEITHRTQDITEVGAIKGLGGASHLFKNMRPAEKKSLMNYIESEFDMTYDLLSELDYTDNQIIYLMLQGELQSNSYVLTIMLESGFKLSSDKNTLISPDGKWSWSLNNKYQTTLSPPKSSIPTDKPKPSIPKPTTNPVYSEGILTKKLPSTKTLDKSRFKALVTAKDLTSISEKEFTNKYANVATNDATQTNPLMKVKVGVNILTSAESDQFLAKAFSLGYEFDNVPNNQKYDFNKWLETGGTGTVYILYNDTKKITITDMQSIDRINFMEDDLKGISLIRYPEGKWGKRELTREVGGELKYIVNPDIIEPHSLIEKSLQWTESAEERLAKSREIQKDLVSADPIYISKTTKDGKLIPKLLVRGSVKADNVKNKGFSQSTNFRDFDKTESPISKLSEFYAETLLVAKDFGEQVNASYATFKKGETAIYNANNRTWQNLKDVFTTKDLAIHKELFIRVRPYYNMLNVAATKAPVDFNTFMEVLKRTPSMTPALFKRFEQDINALLQKYPKVSPRREDGTRDLEFGRESVIGCLVTAAQWYSKIEHARKWSKGKNSESDQEVPFKNSLSTEYDNARIFSIDDIVPVKLLEGYKAIKIDNIIEDTYGSTAKLTNDVIVLRGYDIKRLTSENAADIDVAWKENLKSITRFVSNETAAKSNLKYWIKKGIPIQIDRRVGNFVVSTTNEFSKLPKVLRDKITNGKLNYYDIIDYVSTANKINDYTFQRIAKDIYNNDELSKLAFSEVQQLIVNITDLAAISTVIDTDEVVRSPGQSLMLLQSTLRKAQDNKELSTKLLKAYEIAQRVKIGNKYVDSTPDPKQLVPVFMRHYDGTLSGLRHINNFGKLVAANQQALTLLDAVDAEMYKAKGGVWNWLDRMKRGDIDYEKDETVVEALEHIDKFDKIQVIENYVVSQLTAEINKLSAEEREAKSAELLERYHKATDNLGKLSEEELNKQYLATLANELAEDDQREINPLTSMKNQPRSTKNIKDHLRQTGRNITRRINELNQLTDSDDAINRLSPEVQKVLNKDNMLDVQLYTKLSDKQLEELLESMKNDAKQLTTSIRAAKIKKESELVTKKRIQDMNDKLKKSTDKTTGNVTGKTLRDKINVKHVTKIVNQNFTFNSRELITESAEKLLNTQWGKTGTSKVQGISTNRKQNIHNGETFYRENADTLLSMTTGEAEATVKWFMDANIMDISEDSSEAQSYAAIRLYTLGYIFGQAQDGGQFYNFSHNLKNRLQNYLSTQATLAGTSLAVWNNIREVLNPFRVMFESSLEMGGVELSTDEKQDLMDAAESGNIEDIIKAQRVILDKIKTQKTTSRSIWRKIITIRSMAMLSGPLTWLRYKTSKFMLKPLRNASTRIGEAVFRKKDYAIGQLDMKGQITKEIQAFIDEHIISNGLFDKLVSNLSRYNPSSIQARYKNTTRTPSKDTIFVNMVIKSMYNQFYNENMFDSPRLNKLHRSLMKVMSDNNYVREATIKYFGKILAEKKYSLDKGITDDIMMDFAKAVGIAMKDYMHLTNYFNDIESALAAKSEFGYFMYKLFVPFASTSWNWFKEMMKFTAPGLGRAIYRMATLEEQINKAEEDWQKGKSQVPPEFTEFMIRRDLGSGVIGTLMMILGMMLAGLGFIDLEEKDYGIPRLRIGDLRIDISKIFGSSSLLAGAALIKSWESENFMDAIDAMVEPILDSFIMTQIIELDKYHSGGLASFGLNFLENTLLSFIPAGVRWLSGATYSGTYKPNNMFQKAVARIPFLGSAFNVPKKVNPHTGKEGNMWDAFERVVPYLEIRQTSTIEDNAKVLGLNKTELRGKYEINGEKFNLSAREVAELNKAYGEWNATMLRLFYDNQLRKSTQMDNGTYRELTYSQMTEDQRRRAVKSIYEKNAEYAKIQAWLEAGNAYYASDNDYVELKRRGVKGLLYKGNKGFVKK